MIMTCVWWSQVWVVARLTADAAGQAMEPPAHPGLATALQSWWTARSALRAGQGTELVMHSLNLARNQVRLQLCEAIGLVPSDMVLQMKDFGNAVSAHFMAHVATAAVLCICTPHITRLLMIASHRALLAPSTA